MFAVEHRYYGCWNESSCPVPDTSAPGALRYLSSRQALGDLVAFHSYATARWTLTKNKWVSFGGSYPGMLAGWLRLKFPHLIHAAVASSAPVNASLDMTGYNDMVGFAFSVSHEGVGGSSACLQAIADGHAVIGMMLKNASSRDTLTTIFNLPKGSLENRDAQRDFAGSGVANFPAQSNDPACSSPACDIKSICIIMLNTSKDTVHRLAQVRQLQGDSGQRRQMRPFFRRMEDAGLKAKRMEDAGWIAKRSLDEPDYWGYQTCTEFAFYQTCELSSKCPFTQGLLLLDDFLEECKAFGIPDDKVAANVQYSNAYYGALEPSGSRVLYTSGEVDPWRSLSIVTTRSADLPAFTVAGASHHFWTHPSLPTDQESVVKARGIIRAQVLAWLLQPSNQ